jgi:ATP-binding cassette subfamily B protein
MLQWPTIALGWVVNIFERGEAALARIHAILDAPVEIADQETLPVAELHGELELRGLSFAYDGGRPVLRGIDLRVPAGGVLAIVGPTGAGKSTLVSLLPRLYDAPPGTLFFDGVDARRIPLEVLRRAIGFVPQESFLFSASVIENVAFGLAAGDEPARRAASVAGLEKDVRDFPQGFDTPVGERGITLSGGQKQRAALARALAIEPSILVLDDALSAVDSETEGEILAGLARLRGSRTIVLVSHRVSTVKDADLIVVLREGSIVERGRHAELLALGGFYADLVRRQQLEQEIAGGEDAA